MGAQHKSAGRVPPEVVDRIMQLHERDQLSYATISERLGVSARTASRVIKRVLAERKTKKQTA